MIYPVYVHTGDEKHAHGVTIPDFPGCFSAADTWEKLPDAVQEAIELHCEGEDMLVPKPSALPDLMTNPDYVDGMWLMLDVDIGKISTKAIRINITVPESKLSRIDRMAKKLGVSRSQFLVDSALAD